MKRKYVDLIGKKYGRLTVISINKILQINGRNKIYWNCICECGNSFVAKADELTSHRLVSCGCSRRGSRTPDTNITLLYNQYKRNAKKRNFEFSLTKEEFKKITQENCYYCGKIPSQIITIKPWYGTHKFPYVYNGIDRIDNTKGYILENCRSCCKSCNFIKINMTMDEFKEKIINILKQEKERITNNQPLPLVDINWKFKEIYNRYIARAGTKKIPFTISKEKFAQLTQSNCYYCGQEPTTVMRETRGHQAFIYNGIDRVNNSLGYTEDNVVSCCEICNKIKNTLSKEEFLAHIQKIVTHMGW